MEVKWHLTDQRMAGLIGLQPRVINPFYDATELEKDKKFKEAEEIYRRLLNEDFDNCVLQASLGMNLAVQGEHGLGYALLMRALERSDHLKEDFQRVGVIAKGDDAKTLKTFADQKRAEIMNAIGTCWKHENKTDKARYWFERGQSLIAPNPDIQNNLATLYINEGKPEQAIKHLDTALSLDPTHSQAHWNRSLCLLEQGNYADGFDEYHWGQRADVRANRIYTPPGSPDLPMWDGTPGKKVVVYGEQGIGDEIMFASSLPDMMERCELVVFDCHKRLHTLFCNSFPELDCYPTREDEHITWPIRPTGQPRYPFDAKIAIGDMQRYFRRSLADFSGKPYLLSTESSSEAAKQRLAALPRKPNIGISWIGGHKKTRIEVRSVSLEALAPILKQDANFIVLQYTECEDEIAAFEAKHGIKLHYWPDIIKAEPYDTTAGLVSNLDLVITVCTSVVHLAGALGTPTWVLTPSRPAWRYRLDLDYMPWYGKNNVLFRQQPGNTAWEPVIEEVSMALGELIGATNDA